MPCARYAPSRFIRTGRTTGTARRCTPVDEIMKLAIFKSEAQEQHRDWQEQFHSHAEKERIAAENARLSESLALAENATARRRRLFARMWNPDRAPSARAHCS